MSGRLVVLDASYGDITVELAAAAPYGVTILDAGGVSGAAVVDAAGTADGVLVQYGKIDAEIIERCPSWRVIGRYGVGVDNVDLEAASRQGIAVINVPDYCTEEVATHTAALVLAASRKLARSRALIDGERWGEWSELRPVQPLSGCTLGLVGVGRIGGEVVRLLGPFFGRVIAFDPIHAPPLGVDRVELDELFAQADVVTLHCPLTPTTHNLVDAARLASMKPQALLVNVSRGGLVDTDALAAALGAGIIGGAALDVLPTEPPAPGNPVLTAPNLLLTNHSAWYSETALVTLRRLLAQRCSAYLNGEPVPSLVNGRELAGGRSSVNEIFDLGGRVAVVVGAGGGLGTAICSGLASFGADIALIDIDLESLQASASGVEAHGRRALVLECDASEEAELAVAFSRIDDSFGQVEILVNLAYIPLFGKPEELSLADWERAFRVNVTSYFLACKEAGKRMIASGRGGAIVNMCSIGGTSAIGRGSYPYSISKGGIVMMTKELAVEWARYGIRVNAIQPCQFLTPGLRHRLDNPALGAIKDKFLSGIPLNRLGEPEEMVGPVVFLASDASAMVTGVLLPVDGGNLALNAGGTID